ncbi:Thrombospondin type 3 repeat protein [uncultured archaeon]|nr:Thrombospondin type 3 repeat protein [uncultured archaeon]
MKVDLKNKFTILIILTVSVLSLMSVMIVLSPYTHGPLSKDTDKDGITDKDDNCPTVYNPDQSDADNDSIGDVCDSCTDTDKDGYGNPGFQANECPVDNCPYIASSNQTDTDNDSIGDVCDNCPNDPQNDNDNDGICGGVDNCPNVFNPEQKDSDYDCIGDACEIPPKANFTYTPVYPVRGVIVQFEDTTTLGGGVLQYWQWTFGDNNTSVEQHPEHLYMNVGVYTVQLNVTDFNGKTSTITNIVSVRENSPPNEPMITGPSIGITENESSYKLKTTDPDGDQIYYSIDWGDNTSELNLGPYNSGYEARVQHSWITTGRYIITVKSRDVYNAESDYASLTVRIHKNLFFLNPFFIQFFDQYHQILFFKILYI